MDGTQKSRQEAQVDSPADGGAVDCFPLSFPIDLSSVYFIKLILKSGSQTRIREFLLERNQGRPIRNLERYAEG